MARNVGFLSVLIGPCRKNKKEEGEGGGVNKIKLGKVGNDEKVNRGK